MSVGVRRMWGTCRAGHQRRERLSHAGGRDSEVRPCQGENGVTPLPTNDGGINYIVGACIIGFIIGSCLSSSLVYYYFKYKSKT